MVKLGSTAKSKNGVRLGWCIILYVSAQGKARVSHFIGLILVALGLPACPHAEETGHLGLFGPCFQSPNQNGKFIRSFVLSGRFVMV